MSNTSGIFIEFYDDSVDIVDFTQPVQVIEVTDTEYLEIYDGSFGLPTVVQAENLPFTHAGPLQVGYGLTTYPIKGGTFTILSVAARVTSAPTGSSVIIDVNKNGLSIYGDQSYRPQISSGTYEAVVGTHTVSQVVDGDYLSLDIDQIGSVLTGAYMTVVIRLQRIA